MSSSAMMEMVKNVTRYTDGVEDEVSDHTELTQEEIRTLLQKDQEKRVQQCGKELNELLQRLNCKLTVRQMWTDGIPDGKASIVILAND